MLDFEGELRKAVKHFWQVRGKQRKRQGGKSGKKDAGERGSVTGGKHADGFIKLIAAIVKDAEAFQKRSYAKRYELVCERLVRDRLYDAACFFTSNAQTGRKGEYKEPNPELSIKNLAISLHARAAAFARMGEEIKVLEGNIEE
jgi:hypothetical protein